MLYTIKGRNCYIVKPTCVRVARVCVFVYPVPRAPTGAQGTRKPQASVAWYTTTYTFRYIIPLVHVRMASHLEAVALADNHLGYSSAYSLPDSPY